MNFDKTIITPGKPEEIDPERHALLQKIKKLQNAIDALHKTINELREQKKIANPEDQKELDSEIERFNETIILNEQELKKSTEDLLGHPKTMN